LKVPLPILFFPPAYALVNPSRGKCADNQISKSLFAFRLGWVMKRPRSDNASSHSTLRRMTMAVNHKLTNLIKGRVIIAFEATLTSVRITFKEDSTMKVKTLDPPPQRIAEGVQVREVSENGIEFVLGCEDDTTIDLTLAEPGNSVTVRDKTGAVEYLG
jgi:hypothetical protein